MTLVHWSTAVQKARLRWSEQENGGVDRENAVQKDKTAGQRPLVHGPPLKGVMEEDQTSSVLPTPLGAADHEPPPGELSEPTDEDIWLAGIARQVEADARPLFAHVWVWLLRRALEADEAEPA